MDTQTLLQELESLGSEQTRKTYRRHGVTGNQYGVSYADLDRLTKRIKMDHELALALWESGVHDAQVLAFRLVDPSRMDGELLEEWVNRLDNYGIVDAFASMVVRTPPAREMMEQWTRSDEEWVGRAGWLVLANLAMQDSTLPEEYFRPYVETIQREIHDRKNRVRDAMNSALIAIGLRSQSLREQSLNAAAAIGKVVVDHGDTSCKTPDAAPYILKAWQRKEARQKM